MWACQNFTGPHVWDKPGPSGHLVCLVHLVDLVNLVGLVQANKQDKPNKRDRPDRPNRPNEQDKLADFFSILPKCTLRYRKRARYNARGAPYPSG